LTPLTLYVASFIAMSVRIGRESYMNASTTMATTSRSSRSKVLILVIARLLFSVTDHPYTAQHGVS
jgi:hypothetical protein